MPWSRTIFCALVALVVLPMACSSPARAPDETLRISGSTTVNPVAADAAMVLRERTGQAITVDTQGGSAGGLAQLCSGEIDIAMSSKPIADSDREQFPGCDHQPVNIGEDAVGIVVRREVYDAGVRSLNREQARGIFEARITNWRELGGPDIDIFVYDKEPGRGTREMLDRFLYGPDGKAPPPPDSDRFAIVGGNEETRAKLLSTPGSVGPLSTSFVTDHPDLAVVALEDIAATPETVASGAYPMARPLYLVTDGPPTARAREFIDYVLSPQGQQLLTRHGYLTVAELGR
ncbi:MAG: phosphate ABC transporter substrate-binding protein [Pseudonocardiaceae bacterium]